MKSQSIWTMMIARPGTVEASPRLDLGVIARRYRDGRVTAGCVEVERDALRATYQLDLARNVLFVGLTHGRGVLDVAWSGCHFGGRRLWGLCPACSRRVVHVYPLASRGAWGCRKCAGLRYATEVSSRRIRAAIRAGRLRERLHGPEHPHGPVPNKPPRMRWSTYLRVAAELRVAQRTAGW